MIQWQPKKVKVSQLKEYEGNPRDFTEKGMKELKRSIEKFGIAEPICCNPDLTIIGGHARKKTLIDLGIKEITAWIPERKLNDKEVKELNVRLNKNIAGDWNFDILENNFELDELRDIGFSNIELGLGFDDIDVDKEYKEMPEYGDLKGKEPFRSIFVHFKKKADVDEFINLIKQDITDKTKFIWFPEREREKQINKRYKKVK